MTLHKKNLVRSPHPPVLTACLLLSALACGETADNARDSSDEASGDVVSETGGTQAESGGSSSSAVGGSGDGGSSDGGSSDGGSSDGGSSDGGSGGSASELTKCIRCDEGSECFEEVTFDRCFKLCATETPTVVLETQAEVAALTELNCEVIAKDLTITGSDINDLSALNNLRVVKGALGINNTTTLKNLSGLDALLYVDDGININVNEGLTSLSSLAGMKTGRGSVSFNNNPLLTSLDGMQGVKTPDSIQLIGNVVLSDISALSPESIFQSLLSRIEEAYRTNSQLSDCGNIKYEYPAFLAKHRG